MTPSQRHGLDVYLPIYGLDLEDLKQLDWINADSTPLTVEIGFGMGDSLLTMAAGNPNRNYLGVEVYRAGVGHLLVGIHNQQLKNLKIVNHDAIEVLNLLPPASIDCLQVFFPDPWPKKRHHKRRLINAPFLDLVSALLVPGGCLHVATDWLPYAETIREAVVRHPALTDTVAPGRPETKYEKRGIRQGHQVIDIACCTHL